jgi:hypothetical protein
MTLLGSSLMNRMLWSMHVACQRRAGKKPAAKMICHERDVSVAGRRAHADGRRKEDDRPTLTDRRLDFGHEERGINAG